MAFYKTIPTGLGPEIVYFDGDKDSNVHSGDAHSLLRPESVESWFYLYRITGKDRYRKWSWELMQNLKRYAKLEGGYSSLSSVLSATNIPYRDKMESFFLAETLKYLYLIFSPPDLIPLDKFVFNTEAHPLPIIPELMLNGTRWV